MNNLDAALEYAQHGLHVFAVRPREKVPATQHGHLDATTNPDCLRAQWSTTPEANIGLSCKASGLVAIDVDPRDGGTSTLAALESELCPLPQTVEARTGGPDGGRHLVFRQPEGRMVGTLGPGLDVKHDGYILVAPSVHPSGGVYRWMRSPLEHEPASLPPAWAARLSNPGSRAISQPSPVVKVTTASTPYGRAAVDAELERVRTAPEGRRNNTLNAAAHSLAQLHAGGETNDVREELIAAAIAAGLPMAEAHRTVESGWRAGMGRPRGPLRLVQGSKGSTKVGQSAETVMPDAVSPAGEYRFLESEAARRFGDQIRERFIFVSDEGHWYYYDGKRWARDHGGVKLLEASLSVATAYAADFGAS